MNITFNPNIIVKGPSQADGTDFSTQIVPTLIPVNGTVTAETVKDVSYTKSVAASTLLGATVTTGPSTLPTTVRTDTPSVCSVSGRVVTPLQTGTAGILVTGATGTRRYTQAVSVSPGASNKVTTGYTAGSLAKHVYDAIAAMIAGKTAGATTKDLFSAADYNLDTPSATRNAGLFSGALDLSAVCFARDLNPVDWRYYDFPVVLIAPQIVVFAWHARPGNGTKVTFMRPNGTFQKVTVLGEPVQIGGSANDLGIAKLSAAITGITPMATLGAGYANKLPCLCASPEQPVFAPGVQVPALFKGGRNADYTYANRLDVLPVNSAYAESVNNAPPFIGGFLSVFAPWSDSIVGGDSSGPLMLPINGELVLLCCQWTQPGGATSIPYFRTQIEAAATVLMGSPVTMRTSNLAAFTTF